MKRAPDRVLVRVSCGRKETGRSQFDVSSMESPNMLLAVTRDMATRETEEYPSVQDETRGGRRGAGDGFGTRAIRLRLRRRPEFRGIATQWRHGTNRGSD